MNVNVELRSPKRRIEISGPKRVSAVLAELDVNPETVIVIRGDELLTNDQEVADADTIELRPVISGGAA